MQKTGYVTSYRFRVVGDDVEFKYEFYLNNIVRHFKETYSRPTVSGWPTTIQYGTYREGVRLIFPWMPGWYNPRPEGVLICNGKAVAEQRREK